MIKKCANDLDSCFSPFPHAVENLLPFPCGKVHQLYLGFPYPGFPQVERGCAGGHIICFTALCHLQNASSSQQYLFPVTFTLQFKNKKNRIVRNDYFNMIQWQESNGPKKRHPPPAVLARNYTAYRYWEPWLSIVPTVCGLLDGQCKTTSDL